MTSTPAQPTSVVTSTSATPSGASPAGPSGTSSTTQRKITVKVGPYTAARALNTFLRRPLKRGEEMPVNKTADLFGNFPKVLLSMIVILTPED